MTSSIELSDRERTKRSALIALAVVAVAGVFTLGWYWLVGVDQPKDDPRHTVGKYMSAVRSKDVNTAQGLLCAELAKNKQDVADRAKRFRKLEYSIGRSSKQSDTEYRIDVAVDAVVNLSGEDTPTKTTYIFKVIQENDNWRVCGITT